MSMNVKLDLQGLGDAEVGWYRDLKAGQRALLWYSDDHVWRDNLIGLVIGGEEVVLYTPDNDLYIERIGCKGVGPWQGGPRFGSLWMGHLLGAREGSAP